jgi:hypothetical protein
VSTVLTGIDGSPISSAVLMVAKEIARVLDAQVDAVHVLEDEADVPEIEVSGGETQLRLLRGQASEVLIREASRRTSRGRRRLLSRDGRPAVAGHVSLDVIGGVRKPLIVVPPTTAVDSSTRSSSPSPANRPARSRRSSASPRAQLRRDARSTSPITAFRIDPTTT